MSHLCFGKVNKFFYNYTIPYTDFKSIPILIFYLNYGEIRYKVYSRTGSYTHQSTSLTRRFSPFIFVVRAVFSITGTQLRGTATRL